jgi:hypothetical protein
MTEFNNHNNFKTIVIVLFVIFGIFSILGLVAFIKSFNSKNNFQASSTNYCIPCAGNSGNSYTNTDGTSVPCQVLSEWFPKWFKDSNGGLPVLKEALGEIEPSFSVPFNSATTTKLKTSRTIGGIEFDGTSNISLPGVDQNQTNSSLTWAGEAKTANFANCAGNFNVSLCEKVKRVANGGTYFNCGGNYSNISTCNENS